MRKEQRILLMLQQFMKRNGKSRPKQSLKERSPKPGPKKKSPMMSLKGIFPENRMWNPRKALPKRKPEKRC